MRLVATLSLWLRAAVFLLVVAPMLLAVGCFGLASDPQLMEDLGWLKFTASHANFTSVCHANLHGILHSSTSSMETSSMETCLRATCTRWPVCSWQEYEACSARPGKHCSEVVMHLEAAAVLAVAARGVHSCISAEAVVTNDAESAARHRGGQVAVDSLALVDGSVSGQTRGRKPVGDARGTDARVGERRGRPARGATPRVWTCIALFRLPGKKVPLRMRRTRRVGRLTAQCASRRRGSGDSCHARAAMWPQSRRRRLKPVRTSHTRSHHS